MKSPPVDVRAAAERSGSIEYKWIALAVTTVGAMMFAVDSTIVTLALPFMTDDLHSDLSSMIWVLMGYSLTSTVSLLTFGRLADLLGRVRMYNLGFVVFTVGSVICGLAQTGGVLIAFRVVQGAGGAMMLANSMAIITEAFPANERGRAMGINAVVWAIGSIAGPLIGGVILAGASWRWVFLVNPPIGVVGTVAAFLLLHEVSERNRGERFDAVGAILFSVALIALLFALNLVISLGWTSPVILGLFAACIACAVLFFVWNARSANPVLDMRLFESQVFTGTVIVATLQALAIFAVNLLVVYYLEVVQNQSPLVAAFALVPLSIISSVLGPIGGSIADRIGARRPVVLALVAQVIGLAILSLLRPDSPYLHVVGGLALMGVGSGLYWAPSTSAALSAAPPNRLGVASATLATWRNTGMVVSYAFSLAIAAANVPADAMNQLFLGQTTHLPPAVAGLFATGMDATFRVSAIICVVAAILWWFAAKPTEQI